MWHCIYERQNALKLAATLCKPVSLLAGDEVHRKIESTSAQNVIERFNCG